MLSTRVLATQLHSANMLDRLPLGFLRLGYAITLVIGMYDVRRKYVGAYRKGRYPHPTVRIEIVNDGIVNYLANRGDVPALLDAWRLEGTQGWQRCVFAFHDLNLDAHAGLFGDPGLGPISTLNYTLPTLALHRDPTYLQIQESYRIHRIVQPELRRMLDDFKH
jgi:hypothetical protein